eukprot:SAG31_NODE_2563_length_5473_cov_6.924823_5_plen_422_part_00
MARWLALCAAFGAPDSALCEAVFSRRAGLAPPQQLIGEPIPVGPTPWLPFPNDRDVAVPTRFNWSTGTPVQRVASTESGLFVASTNSTPPSGFALSIRVPLLADIVVRLYVGTAGSLGQLNATLYDRAGKQIDVVSCVRPAGLSQTATVRIHPPATAAGETSLHFTWVQVPDDRFGYNINFQAIAVQSAATNTSVPCARALCSDVVTCSAEPPGGSNCTTVDLDTVGDLDWLHAGDSSLWPGSKPKPKPKPPTPFPGPPECELPAALRKGLSRPQSLQIPGPAPNVDHENWLADLRRWRITCRATLRLSSKVYEIEELKWTQTAYYQPLTMPYDRYFFNETSGEYTVDRWLDSLEKTVGGVDAAVLWSGYTNMGVDNRDQFELMRSLPGGVASLRRAVEAMHARGVKALLPCAQSACARNA